jgi:hypothetical protein
MRSCTLDPDRLTHPLSQYTIDPMTGEIHVSWVNADNSRSSRVRSFVNLGILTRFLAVYPVLTLINARGPTNPSVLTLSGSPSTLPQQSSVFSLVVRHLRPARC